MADVKKEVVLDFTANTRDAKRAMQEFKAYQQDMSQNVAKIQTTGLKGQKDLFKITKKTQKTEQQTRGKKGLLAERRLQREVKKTTSEIVKRERAYKSIIGHVDKLKGRIRAVSQESSRMGRSLQRSMGGLFGGGGGGGGGGRMRKFGRRMNVGGGAAVTNMFKGLGGMLSGGLLGLLGGAFGLLTGQLSGGYQERMQYGRAYGGLAGSGGRLSALTRQRGFGVRMGLGPIEMAQQALPLARATGQVGGGALHTSMALQRASTLNAGEATSFMGLLTQAGQGFGGKAGKGGKNEIIKTLALGVHGGLDKARMPEFFAATSQLVQRQMAASGGDVSTGPAAKLLAMLGASKHSGLQGARGGAVASALDRAIRTPGGGAEGEAFMMRAFDFGVPGGGASYMQAHRRMQQGIHGEGNLRAMFQQADEEYGGGEASIRALENITQLTADQLDKVKEVLDSNKSGTAEQKALNEITKGQKSVEEQALDEMREFGDTTQHMAHLQDRSIGIGQDIKESVERIQKIVNDGILMAMPLVVDALEKIAEIVENIWNWLQGVLPGLLGKDIEAAAKKKSELVKEARQLAADERSGNFSREDIEGRRIDLARRFRSASMSLSNNQSWVSEAADVADDARVKILETLNVDTGPSRTQRRNSLEQSMTNTSDRLLGEVAANRRRSFLSDAYINADIQAINRGVQQSSPSTRAQYGALASREQQEFEQGDTTLSSEFRELANVMLRVGRSNEGLIEAMINSNAGRPPNEQRATARPTTTGRGD